MREMSLEEIKNTGYSLLIVLKEFCEKNQLQYFLSNGTLLGAIKYEGYIPWDDDVDVFMPREDYDKFISKFEDNKKIKLFSYERQAGYDYPFAKLCDMTTLKEEAYQLIDTSLKMGICVDIFPLDNYENNYMVAKMQAKIASLRVLLVSLSRMKCLKNKTPFKVLLYKIIRMIGYERLKKFIQFKNLNFKNNSKYVGNRVWAIYGTKEVLPREIFSGSCKAKFETEEFVIPIGYHQYLTSLYGNYKEDPPKERQKSHHSYIAYKYD